MRRRLTFAALLTLAVLVGVVPLFFGEANPDVAWYSFLAERLLDGTDLYTQILEVNPPGPVWAALPAAVVADALRLETTLVFNLLVLLAVLGTLAAIYRNLDRAGVAQERRWEFVAVVAVALLLVPGLAYGQREHFAVIFSLPYLLLLSMEETNRSGGGGPVGLVAGLGFAFKPHFVAVPVVAEGWAWLRGRGSHRLVRPATVAMAAVLAVYATAVVLLEPDYLIVLRNLVLPFYPHFNPRPWWEGLTSVPALFTYAGLAAACLCLRRRRGGSGHPAFAFVLYGLAWLGVAVLQQQHMSYHYLPAVVHAMVAMGAAAVLTRADETDRPARDRPGGQAVAPGRIAAWVGIGVFGLVFAYVQGESLRQLVDDEPTEYERLRAIVRAHQGGNPRLAALNLGFAKVYSLLNDTGAEWTLRYPGVWPVLAARRKARSEAPSSQVRTSSELCEDASLCPLSRAEREFRDQMVGDLVSGNPGVFLVPHVLSGGHEDRIDILAYFRQDTAFARWLDGYRHRATVAGLEVYVRQRAGKRPSSFPADGDQGGAERRPQGGQQPLLQAGEAVEEPVDRGGRHRRWAEVPPGQVLDPALDQPRGEGPVEQVVEPFDLQVRLVGQAPEAPLRVAGPMVVDLVVARPQYREGRDGQQQAAPRYQEVPTAPEGRPGPGEVLQHVGHEDEVEPAGQ